MQLRRASLAWFVAASISLCLAQGGQPVSKGNPALIGEINV